MSVAWSVVEARGALEVDFNGAQNAMLSLCTCELHSTCREILHQRLELLGGIDADNAIRARDLERGDKCAQQTCQRAWLDALQQYRKMYTDTALKVSC